MPHTLCREGLLVEACALNAYCPSLRQAGYTAEARFALDGDESTFWSSTGGEVRVLLRHLAAERRLVS